MKIDESSAINCWKDWIQETNDPGVVCKKPEALDHLTVLDCSHGSLSGCFASSILAEMGAEVIRVEAPGGDSVRSYSPWGYSHMGTGLGYLNEGRNKFHVTLNMESARGRRILAKLARRADVLIETFLPGLMHEWGLGYKDLRMQNPGLIYCALSTYGQFGPEAGKGKVGAEIVDQAYSGVTAVTGEASADPDVPQAHEAPTKQGNWMAWYAGGSWGALAILAALHYRGRTGQGQFIDVSPAEAFGRCVNYSLTYCQAFGEAIPRVGNYDVGVFPYTYFKCRDGYVFLSGFSDINWKALCTILDRLDLQAKYPSISDRLNIENMKVVHKEIEEWTRERTYEEIHQAVMSYNTTVGEGIVVPGRIMTPDEVLSTEHWWMRGAFQKVQDPYYGELLVANQPWKMSETPPRVKWCCRPVGADNQYIYGTKLGYGPSRLQELTAEGVI